MPCIIEWGQPIVELTRRVGSATMRTVAEAHETSGEHWSGIVEQNSAAD